MVAKASKATVGKHETEGNIQTANGQPQMDQNQANQESGEDTYTKAWDKSDLPTEIVLAL